MFPINFKCVITGNTKTYDIDPQWTTEQLYTNVSERIRDDFHININELELIDLDISHVRYPGIRAEDYPPLSKSNTIRLSDLCGLRTDYLAFYVRKIESSHGECIVCLSEQILCSRYQCTHTICTSCYLRCLNSSIMTCPMCRQP